jgi:MHS family citrate/tricarballylate:H+ symporter-like MFS transporter
VSDFSGANLPLRQVAAVAIGNALEFYDFLTFSFFAVQIGHCFFPDSTTKHGLLFTLATFGVGFLARPLGGIFIGRYGDRGGRKPAMLLSFSLMGLGILGVALTPSYDRIGVAAPILLFAFRLIQGFALGGEVGPSSAFLVEAAPPHRRGLYLSLQGSSQMAAVLAAGLAGATLASVLSPQALDAWGWRVAFLGGAAIVPFGLAMRRTLPETIGLADMNAAPGALPRLQPAIVVMSLLMLGSATISTYSVNYMSVYAQDTLKLPAGVGFGTTIVNGLVGMVMLGVAGWLCDRTGRKRMMLVSMAATMLLVVPSFIMITHFRTALALYAAVAALAFVGSFVSAPMLLLITEALPKRVRSGSMSIIYAVAIAVFGGSTQFILKALIDATGSAMAPAWYMTGALVVGAVAMLFMPESAPA